MTSLVFHGVTIPHQRSKTLMVDQLKPALEFKGECSPLSLCYSSASSLKPLRSRQPVAVSASHEPLGTKTLGGVTEVEDETALEQYFQEAADKLVVLDVSTRTCGPCKMIYPKLVKMSREFPDAVFLKIYGDLNNDTRTLMRKWGVRAVPNFRFFRNGRLIHSHTGANEGELRAYFLKYYMERETP